jgi:hypothetical protein
MFSEYDTRDRPRENSKDYNRSQTRDNEEDKTEGKKGSFAAFE